MSSELPTNQPTVRRSTASRDEILLGIQRVWSLCGFGDKDDVRREVPEGELAKEALHQARLMLVPEHLLVPVARSAIETFVTHAQAIDAIGATSAAQLHMRALEEVSTFLEFVLLDPGRYKEFRWRWDNFKGLMVIRNALRREDVLRPELQAWLDANTDQLQWFKLKNVLPHDKKRWSKIQHWLYPIRIDEIFAAVNRSGAYDYESYALNSHFVHLSPVAEYLIEFEAGRSSLREVIGNVGAQVVSILHALLPVVADVRIVRREMLRPVLRYLHRSVSLGSTVIREASHDDDQVGLLMGEVTRQDFNFERLANVALGSIPLDPLAIRAK